MSKADIIIIPVYFSLSHLGLCRNHKDNINDLEKKIKKIIKKDKINNDKRKYLIVGVCCCWRRDP
jgi:ABC-type uncharacterized transport system permease subunit